MVGFQRRVARPNEPKPVYPGTSIDRYSEITAITYDGLVPGDFAFRSAQVGRQSLNIASKTGGYLLGMVIRKYDPYRNNYPYDNNVHITILVRGQVYAVVPEGQTPSFGQAVLCDPASGEVTYGKAGDPNDTGWKVLYVTGLTTDQGRNLVVYEKL